MIRHVMIMMTVCFAAMADSYRFDMGGGDQTVRYEALGNVTVRVAMHNDLNETMAFSGYERGCGCTKLTLPKRREVAVDEDYVVDVALRKRHTYVIFCFSGAKTVKQCTRITFDNKVKSLTDLSVPEVSYR